MHGWKERLSNLGGFLLLEKSRYQSGVSGVEFFYRCAGRGGDAPQLPGDSVWEGKWLLLTRSAGGRGRCALSGA